MGRLTLNVLLSFAQFEREVTAERIRDKIAASKRKGMWMGGTLPLGYDRHPDPLRRELVVKPVEAATIRRLFALYAEHGNLRSVRQEAAPLGLGPRKANHGKDQAAADPSKECAPFTNGQLHNLLTNPVYRGLTRHKKKTFPGLHAAIIDAALWDEVQAKLIAASARQRGQQEEPHGRGSSETGTLSPLVGKLRDETGDRLTPSHTQRHGRKRHYYVSYVSRRLLSATKDPAGW
jgi:site-specific DNA recombinase